MKRRPPIPFLLLLAGLAACAGGRDALLARSFAGATAASKLYDSLPNAQIEAGIVANATSKEAGEAALSEYRSKRVKAGVAIGAVFTAIGVASTDPTDASVQATLDALKAALDALKQIGAIP